MEVGRRMGKGGKSGVRGVKGGITPFFRFFKDFEKIFSFRSENIFCSPPQSGKVTPLTPLTLLNNG
jgi:hypothetical protein